MSRKNRSAVRRRSKLRTRQIWTALRRWALLRGLVIRRRRCRPARRSATSACSATTRSRTSPAARPMEAAAQGIKLGPADWAVRCNLVTIEDQVMRDFTADHISTEEGTKLLASCQEQIASDPKYRGAVEFVPGVSYRNLLMWRGAKLPAPFTNDTRTRAPHDITDQSVLEDHPRGPGSDVLTELMTASVDVFRDHPVNTARVKAGKRPATNVWLWGLGPGAASAAVCRRIRPAWRHDHGCRPAARHRRPGRLGPHRGAGRDRLSGYRLRGQRPGGRRGPQEIRYRVRPRRSFRRGLARRPLRRKGEGDRRDRPARRRARCWKPSSRTAIGGS